MCTHSYDHHWEASIVNSFLQAEYIHSSVYGVSVNLKENIARRYFVFTMQNYIFGLSIFTVICILFESCFCKI